MEEAVSLWSEAFLTSDEQHRAFTHRIGEYAQGGLTGVSAAQLRKAFIVMHDHLWKLWLETEDDELPRVLRTHLGSIITELLIGIRRDPDEETPNA